MDRFGDYVGRAADNHFKPEVFNGVITGVNSNDGTYNVRVNGRAFPFENVPNMMSNLTYTVGDNVMVGLANGDNQLPMIMGLGIQNKLKKIPGSKTSSISFWPMFRQNITHNAFALTTATAAKADATIVSATTKPASMMRTGFGYILAFDPAKMRICNSNAVPITPDSTLVVVQAVFDPLTGAMYMVDAAGGLSLFNFGFSTSPVLNGARTSFTTYSSLVLEPMFITAYDPAKPIAKMPYYLWVLNNSASGIWVWKQVDLKTLTKVYNTVNMKWRTVADLPQLPYSTLPAPPGGAPSNGFPIFFYNGLFSRVNQSTYVDTANFLTTSALPALNNLVIPAGGDKIFLDAQAVETTQVIVHEKTNPHNCGRVYDRPSIAAYDLRNVDSNGAIKRWELVGWSSNSLPNVTGVAYNPGGAPEMGYAGISPIMLSKQLGNIRYVLAHVEVNEFSKFTFQNLIYSTSFNDTVTNIKNPGNYDGVFSSFYWNPTLPCPPWFWKEAYLDYIIPTLMPSLKPTFSGDQNRDVQTAIKQRFCVINAETGAIISNTVIPSTDPDVVSSTLPPNVVLSQYLDTGNPATGVHNTPTLTSHPPPKMMYNGDIAPYQKTGTQSGPGPANLRTILALDPDERVVSWMAIERFLGDTWTAFSESVGGYFPGDGSFSYYTGVTFFRDGVVTATFGPGFILNGYNEFGPLPPTYTPSWDEYAIGAIGGEYVGLTTVNNYFIGHVAYCDNGDGTFNETGVSFSNYTDPDHRFSVYTDSVSYTAWVVKVKSTTCTVQNPDFGGWDPWNKVDDGEYVFFLPRVIPNKGYGAGWGPVYSNSAPSLSHDPSKIYPRGTINSSNNFWYVPRYAMAGAPPAASSPSWNTVTRPQITCLHMPSAGSFAWVYTFPTDRLITYQPVAVVWTNYLFVLMGKYLYKFQKVTGALIVTKQMPDSWITWTYADMIIIDQKIVISNNTGIFLLPLFVAT